MSFIEIEHNHGLCNNKRVCDRCILRHWYDTESSLHISKELASLNSEVWTGYGGFSLAEAVIVDGFDGIFIH